MLAFQRECFKCLIKVVGKLQDKPPMKFSMIRHAACLDPTKIYEEPEWCIKNMKSIVQTFLQGKKLTGGIPAGKKMFMYRDSRSGQVIQMKAMFKGCH